MFKFFRRTKVKASIRPARRPQLAARGTQKPQHVPRQRWPSERRRIRRNRRLLFEGVATAWFVLMLIIPLRAVSGSGFFVWIERLADKLIVGGVFALVFFIFASLLGRWKL